MDKRMDKKSIPFSYKRIIAVALAIGITLGSMAFTSTSSAEAETQNSNTNALSEAIPSSDEQPLEGKTISTDSLSSDVTIKDDLTEDEASVTDIKVNQIIDGTEPFDNDDARGNDSGKSNLRVRSFDRVTYLIETTVTPDDAMTYYKNGRIGYEITLPLGKNKAVFNYEVMGWVDQTKGYEPQLSTDEDGSQTLTVFKKISATDESPTVIPGVYEVPIVIDVKAMHEGEVVRPKFRAWASPNSQKHRALEITPNPIVVTSIPKYDISLRGDGYQTSGAPNSWDFDKTDPKDKPITSSDGMNRGLGVRKGVISYIRFGIDMRWKNTAKQLRGLEIPRAGEPLRIQLDVSNTVTKDGNGNPIESDARLQPYFWAANSHYGYMQGMKSRETAPTWRVNEWSSYYPYFYNESIRVYNGGSLTINQTRLNDKTVLDITIKDWELDPNQFPRGPGNYTQCNAGYSAADCTITVGEFSQGAIFMFSPTGLDGEELGVHYNSAVTLKQHVETSGMEIKSETGDLITTQENPTDSHGNPTNNIYNGGLQLMPSGGFSMQTWYACSKPRTTYQSYSTECSGWKGATFNGSDKASINSMVRLHMQSNYATDNSWDLAGVFSINLAKIDDKLIDVPEDLQLSDAANNSDSMNDSSGGWWNGVNGGRGFIRPIIRYATKPDGKGWVSDEEQSNAQIEDLMYWDSYAEARSHGVIVGYIMLSKEAGGNNSTSFFPLRAMVHVKNDPSNIGKTAQFTQIAESWTRRDLIKAGVVPSNIKIDDSKSTWDAWTKTIDPMKLRKKVKPTYHMDSKNHYRKSTYDSAGVYIPGTEGMTYGDTLLITGETTKIGLSTEQQKPNNSGIGKTIYDLDNGQRYIDWLMTPSSEFKDDHNKTTDHSITVTIPKGLSYVTGSSYINGTYNEHTPNQGSSTGTQIEPIATINKDGTTTLDYVIPEVKTDGNLYPLRFSTYIGDPTDPDNDAKNGQQYKMIAKIQSSYDIAPSTISNLKMAEFTVQVSRTRANQLAARALSLINDTDQPLKFKSMIANSSSTDKSNVWAVGLLPWNGIGGSNYRGDHSLTSIDLNGIGFPINGNTIVYITTNPKYRTILDPSGKENPAMKITEDEILNEWTKVPLNSNGTADLSSIKDKATGFAIHLDKLYPKTRLEVVWAITPKDNSGSDVYDSRWSDLSNTVTALASIADREVNGVVWWDRNEDGVRQSDEPRIPNVKVEVIDSNGNIITKTDGSKAVTHTDKDGRWSVSKIPSGTGYKAKLTPKASDGWIMNTTTLKKREDAPIDKNSDADPLLVLNRMEAAEISLKPFPTVDRMTSSRYVDSYEDTGLKYANFVSRTTPNTGSRDLMIVTTSIALLIVLITAGTMLHKDRQESNGSPKKE